MKTILYAAAALMIAASIYGFIDYSKTSSNKEFQNMYDEKNEVVPVAVSKEPVTGDTGVQGPAETPAVVKEEPVKNAVVKRPVVKKLKKTTVKRKINHKSFSRAPIREVIEIPRAKTLEEEGQEKSIQ